jgi:hypothetical protein
MMLILILLDDSATSDKNPDSGIELLQQSMILHPDGKKGGGGVSSIFFLPWRVLRAVASGLSKITLQLFPLSSYQYIQQKIKE